MKLGVIADTHGFLHPSIPEIFSGVETILHAGDVGSRGVLTQLEQIAQVLYVAGNHEPEPLPSPRPDFSIIELAGRNILLTHVLTTMAWNDFQSAISSSEVVVRKLWPGAQALLPADLIIFGHTHFPVFEAIGSTHFLNPGYAGPDPHEADPTVALLQLAPGILHAEIIRLNSCARKGAF